MQNLLLFLLFFPRIVAFVVVVLVVGLDYKNINKRNVKESGSGSGSNAEFFIFHPLKKKFFLRPSGTVKLTTIFPKFKSLSFPFACDANFV